MGEKLSVPKADIGESMFARGDFASIRPYAEMGMSSGEIRKALIIDKNINSISVRSIGLVMGQARVRGELRHFTTEEQKDIERDEKRQSERRERTQSVLRWLFTSAILTVHNESVLGERNSLQRPRGRLEWKDRIKNLDEEGAVENIISTTKPLILRRVPLIDIVKIHQVFPHIGSMSDQEKSFAFVNWCLGEGLIGEDLSSWHEIQRLYGLHNRVFTKDPSKRIRLEIFFRAIRAINTRGEKGMGLLLRYKELGEKIDPGWFDKILAEEEDFIAGNLNNAGKEKIGEDLQGIYRIGPNGEKLYTPLGIDDGKVIFDNSYLRARRRFSQTMVQEDLSPRKAPYSSLS